MHTRKTIVALLKRQPHTTRQLAEHFDTSRQAIDYHIRALREKLNVEVIQVVTDEDTGRMAKTFLYSWKETGQ
jgi:predicted ArsR family transcriptional regulator